MLHFLLMVQIRVNIMQIDVKALIIIGFQSWGKACLVVDGEIWHVLEWGMRYQVNNNLGRNAAATGDVVQQLMVGPSDRIGSI